MKKLFTLTILLFSFFAKADYWTQKAMFPGDNKRFPFSFSIGNKGYIGCGTDTNSIITIHSWEYDQITNTWTQIADFGGPGRTASASFSIGNKGYVCCGEIYSVIVYNDLWEYDPSTNTWTQKANLIGTLSTGHIFGAVGFSIGNKGYICCGKDTNGSYSSYLSEYDPSLDSWSIKNPFPSFGRVFVSGFSTGNKSYVTTGFWNGVYLNDLWQYDPILDHWTQKANLPGMTRFKAAGFSIGNKGYLGIGQNNVFLNDFWEYNPQLNQWVQKANFPGTARNEAAFFSINCKGYIGLGRYSTQTFNDFWEYTPDRACATGIEEFPISNVDFTISPNPAKDYIIISYPSGRKENIDITITNAQGKKVYETKLLLTSDFRLPTSGFQKGIYLVEVSNGKQKAVKKFVKE